MAQRWTRRSFLTMALGAALGLVGCALPTPPPSPADAPPETPYRATPLALEDAVGTTVNRDEDEWRAILSPLQFRVMRENGTQRAFTGAYHDHTAEGTYHCSACGNPLFSSAMKYDAGTGWPSYWAPVAESVVTETEDRSFGMVRTEVRCVRCNAHLGHVFPDGPEPSGLRYCINDIALNFAPTTVTQAQIPASPRDLNHEEEAVSRMPGTTMIFDFTSPETAGQWLIVNDDVMGGVSESEVALTGRQTMVFRGTLSLENNGGFASVRTQPQPYALVGYGGFQLRVKGDGRRYKLRVRTERTFDGPAYEQTFETVADTWTTVTLDFQDMTPTFRGQRLRSFPRLDSDKIQQISLMIADRQAGPFELEVDWIRAYRMDT
jgi:peptide-methionine (R)-S-oxide reductase